GAGHRGRERRLIVQSEAAAQKERAPGAEHFDRLELVGSRVEHPQQDGISPQGKLRSTTYQLERVLAIERCDERAAEVSQLFFEESGSFDALQQVSVLDERQQQATDDQDKQRDHAKEASPRTVAVELQQAH